MERDRPDRFGIDETVAGLRRALATRLPGEIAYREAFPRGFGSRTIPEGVGTTEAAVLLLLLPDDDRCRFRIPLIVRTESMGRHAGQVALPGGVVDGGETIRDAALREAFEEIGLDMRGVDILGELTPILIPVSRFRVHVVVGFAPVPFPYRLQDREVIRVIDADPDRLVAEGPSETIVQTETKGERKVPAYIVDGEVVWGATALIMAEFLHVWRPIRRRRRSHPDE